MFAHLACNQQVLNLLLENHASAWPGQQQQGSLRWLPFASLAGFGQLQRISLRVAQQQITIHCNGITFTQETQFLRLRCAGRDGCNRNDLEGTAGGREWPSSLSGLLIFKAGSMT